MFDLHQPAATVSVHTHLSLDICVQDDHVAMCQVALITQLINVLKEELTHLYTVYRN